MSEWAAPPALVSSTPPQERSLGSGYWWLAFAWDNWSLSCKSCNQGWKRNLFPVEVRRPCVEGVEHTERPLLLDPGAPFRSADHFRWTEEGYILPESPRGEATIRTCGLNRPDLVPLRLKAYRDVEGVLRALLGALRRHAPVARLNPLVASIGERGARHAEFAGMVRWQTEGALGVRWEQIEGLPE